MTQRFDPYDPYVPGPSDPADNIFLVDPNDADDLPIGVKALRIYNPTDQFAAITVTTVLGNYLTLPIPPACLWTEPVRVRRVWDTGTSSFLTIHGYTDVSLDYVR